MEPKEPKTPGVSRHGLISHIGEGVSRKLEDLLGELEKRATTPMPAPATSATDIMKFMMDIEECALRLARALNPQQRNLQDTLESAAVISNHIRRRLNLPPV